MFIARDIVLAVIQHNYEECMYRLGILVRTYIVYTKRLLKSIDFPCIYLFLYYDGNIKYCLYPYYKRYAVIVATSSLVRPHTMCCFYYSSMKQNAWTVFY